MGSIQLEDIQGRVQQKPAVVGSSGTGQLDCSNAMSFKILDLRAPEENRTTTGMRDEIALLSWLLVLLRTQDDSETVFEWAYKERASDSGHETVIRSLKMDEVITDSRNKVGHVASSIATSMKMNIPSQSTTSSCHASLLLSTSSLSQTAQETVGHVSD